VPRGGGDEAGLGLGARLVHLGEAGGEDDRRAAPGTATMATSGTSGRLATSGKARSPCTRSRFGFTGRMAPENPWDFM
jgi:hypothetical protein